MLVWGRRIGVFALVLAFAVALAHTVRTRIAHASSIIVSRGTPPQLAASNPSALTPESPRSGPVSSASSHSSAAPGSSRGAAALPGIHPGMRTFHDRSYKVSFDFPASWNFAERDHEISTFRLDARTAEKKTAMRAVAALPENPYPASTFTGGFVYLSVTPRTSQSRCLAQAAAAHPAKPEIDRIAGLSFAHGHDEQRHICTVERDEIYTTFRKGACYRFDLAMNNFCGGEVSGVKDVTDEELETVRARLESVLSTIRFDSK